MAKVWSSEHHWVGYESWLFMFWIIEVKQPSYKKISLLPACRWGMIAVKSISWRKFHMAASNLPRQTSVAALPAPILGQCWDQTGTMLGPDWDNLGTMLGQCWDHVGTDCGAARTKAHRVTETQKADCDDYCTRPRWLVQLSCHVLSRAVQWVLLQYWIYAATNCNKSIFADILSTYTRSAADQLVTFTAYMTKSCMMCLLYVALTK